MSYVKTTWADGDVITAQKLNKIEQGIADASSVGGMLIGHKTDGTTYQSETDLTWKQVYDAMRAGLLVVFISGWDEEYEGQTCKDVEHNIVKECQLDPNNTYPYFVVTHSGQMLVADNENGYLHTSS